MKVAVVSTDGRTISKHFGRAGSIVVVTVRDGQVISMERRTKPDCRDASRPERVGNHGVQCQHGSPGKDRHARHGDVVKLIADCGAVLSCGMGQGIYEMLKAAGIRPVLTRESDLNKAVGAYLDGSLEEDEELVHCRSMRSKEALADHSNNRKR